jgi:hypothetical protein
VSIRQLRGRVQLIEDPCRGIGREPRLRQLAERKQHFGAVEQSQTAQVQVAVAGRHAGWR